MCAIIEGYKIREYSTDDIAMKNTVNHYSSLPTETTSTTHVNFPPLTTYEAIQSHQNDLRESSAELASLPPDEHPARINYLLGGLAALSQTDKAYPHEVVLTEAEVAGNVHRVYSTDAIDKAVEDTIVDHRGYPYADHQAVIRDVTEGVSELSTGYDSPVIQHVLERLSHHYAEETGNSDTDEIHRESRLAFLLAIIGTTRDTPFAHALIQAGSQVDRLQGRNWDSDVIVPTESIADLKREQIRQRQERDKRVTQGDIDKPSQRMSLEDLLRDDEPSQRSYPLKIAGIWGIEAERNERLAYDNEVEEHPSIRDERLVSTHELESLIAEAKNLSQS